MLESQEEQQLVGPDDLTVRVDHADPVAIAIKRDSQIRLGRHHREAQLAQVLRNRRIRVVRGKAPIHPLVEKHVQPREAPSESLDDRSRRAIAAIPDYARRCDIPRGRRQAFDIRMRTVFSVDRKIRQRPTTRGDRFRSNQLRQGPAEYRLAVQQQLEAVLVRRVMRARHHDAAIELRAVHGEIHLGSRAHPHTPDVCPGCHESVDQRVFEGFGGEPAIPAYRDFPLATRARYGGVGNAESIGVTFGYLPPHDSADVVSANRGGIDAIGDNSVHVMKNGSAIAEFQRRGAGPGLRERALLKINS